MKEEIGRSDSQRSETKPRVSFNRDVHVKRIVPREGARTVGALNGDGQITAPVRRERLSKSKKELAEEAARVLHQADGLDCVSQDHAVLPERFYTLPTPKNKKTPNAKRRNSEELGLTSELPPKKPPRAFETVVHTKKNSLFVGLFKKPEAPRKASNLKRSVSDATNLKSKAFSPEEPAFRKRSGSQTEEPDFKGSKKQLSPIIENSPKEDYFGYNKENVCVNVGASSVTEKLKEFIDEIDSELFEETGVRPQRNEEREAEVVIIDLEKAEKIAPKSKSKTLGLGKRIKSLASKNKAKVASKNKIKDQKEIIPRQKSPERSASPGPKIREAIESLETQAKKSPTMIHSSQKPAEKLPLTRGRTVNHMVKRLSNDSCSPPRKTNIMITPNISVQHNNNQPFSYTRGLSPEKTNDSSPIIYAQVVCNNGTNPSKQTIHTAYMNGKKHVPHSDSDEGLGYEEHSSFNNRKYETGHTTVTHFGGRSPEFNYRYEEESPIKPSFKYTGFNGYTSKFVDSSSRGRGDGMDAKRRESLTESPENGTFSKLNGRSDLSARRDLLESRINRRFGDKYLRDVPSTNIYVSEHTSKYYRGGSSSPQGYKEKYLSETKVDKRGEKFVNESHTKKYFGEELSKNYDYNGYDNEPKSFDSHISNDYRISPENRHFETTYDYRSKYKPKPEKLTNKEYHKSNPEIFQKPYIHSHHYQESYHDSLRRDRDTNITSTKSRYFDQESDRKDKFGDSGIENDFRRDSGENFRYPKPKRDYCNESEDEGFASSLLIASERQHTEDNFNARKHRQDYDSDRSFRKDDPYRHVERFDDYRKQEYAHRERSIDDGSHFDPRIDKDTGTLKRVSDKKPPKPEKKSSLEKVKQLFSRDKKKKEKLSSTSREDVSRARYSEYKGSRENLEAPMKRKEMNDMHASYDYSNRRRLSSPSPSPTREVQRNGKSETTHNSSWFKSLDRLSRKKSKKHENGNITNPEDEIPTSKPPPTKNLRFFGDTDIESNDSLRQKTPRNKTRAGFCPSNARSQSTRDLHNITEERRSPDLTLRKTGHKSMLNISDTDRDAKGSRMILKPPVSPSHRANREGNRFRDERTRRMKNEFSSVESSTEGDSSQQSQRSVVYLHAATVGDIPGPGYLRNGRRAASREELASNSSIQIQPQVKTLSRSFSVLAPWKPRHYREGMDIDYTQYPKKNGKYEQKVTKNGSRKESTSTLKKKAQETRKSNQSISTLKSRSKENLSTLKRSRDEGKGSSSTLYKKKERQSNGNSRYNREKDDKRAKSMSVEYLSGNGRVNGKRDVSRSVSMPRDPEKSAGWFKKSEKKSMSSQRL